MSTAIESQHTAGAMRAARKVMSSTSPLTVNMMAEIIDRETAAPAMLEALEMADERLRELIVRMQRQCDYVDSLDGEGSTEDYRRYLRLAETARKDNQAAIRLAKGESL